MRTLSKPPLRHRLLPLLLAVLVAACGDVTTAGSEPSPSPSAPECPGTFDGRELKPAVPAPPSAPDSEGRLVPETQPRSVAICRYSGVQDAPSSLEGTRHLRDFTGIADDLQLPAVVPGEGRACTLIGSVHVPYLVRLQYPSGIVWVSTYSDANGCQDTGNGTFTSKVYIGDDVASSYDAGRWTHAPKRGGNPCFERVGRAGQERTLLPEGAVRIRICNSAQELPPIADERTIAELTRLLNAQQTEPSHGGCEGPTSRSRELLVEYASGRAVAMHVLDGCRPNTFTSSLATQLAADEMARLFELLEG